MIPSVTAKPAIEGEPIPMVNAGPFHITVGLFSTYTCRHNRVTLLQGKTVLTDSRGGQRLSPESRHNCPPGFTALAGHCKLSLTRAANSSWIFFKHLNAWQVRNISTRPRTIRRRQFDQRLYWQLKTAICFHQNISWTSLLSTAPGQGVRDPSATSDELVYRIPLRLLRELLI